MAQMVQEQDDAMAGAAAAAVPPAAEPLQSNRVESLIDAVAGLAKKVDPNGLDLKTVLAIPPDPETGKTPKKLDALPPQLGTVVLALHDLVVLKLKAEQHAFTPGDLTTNTGILKVSGKIDGMAKDKELVAQLAPPDPAEAPPPPEATGPETGELDQTDQDLMAYA